MTNIRSPGLKPAAWAARSRLLIPRHCLSRPSVGGQERSRRRAGGGRPAVPRRPTGQVRVHEGGIPPRAFEGLQMCTSGPLPRLLCAAALEKSLAVSA